MLSVAKEGMIPPPLLFVNLVLSLYNAMAPPVDVGGLPNHVKYCVSVLSLQWVNIRTSPVRIPYSTVVYIKSQSNTFFFKSKTKTGDQTI